MTKRKDWEVVHYGPVRWDAPSEKKHYSRHASLEEANTHARKIIHKNVPKGFMVDHWNSADDPDEPSHAYFHVNEGEKRLGDSIIAQRRGSTEKFVKDFEAGKKELDPAVVKPLLDFAFKKSKN